MVPFSSEILLSIRSHILLCCGTILMKCKTQVDRITFFFLERLKTEGITKMDSPLKIDQKMFLPFY